MLETGGQKRKDGMQDTPAEGSTGNAFNAGIARRFMLLPAAVLLMISIAVVFLGAKERKFDSDIAQAVAFLEQNQYEDAYKAYREIANLYPDHTEGYLGMAEALCEIAKEKERKQDYSGALDTYEQADRILADGLSECTGYFDRKRLRDKEMETEEKVYDARENQRSEDYVWPEEDYSSDELPADYFVNKDSQRLKNGGDYYEALPFDSSLWDSSYEPWGGVILVRYQDKMGAVNYDGEMIVPFEYDVTNTILPPTEDGFFVLRKGGYRYLFDAEGRQIYSTMDEICAAKDYYLVIHRQNDEAQAAGSNEDVIKVRPGQMITDYYRYDGTLVVTTARETFEDYNYDQQYAFADEKGNLVLYENRDVTEEYDLKQETELLRQKLQEDAIKEEIEPYDTITVSAVIRERYGLLAPDGTVTWEQEIEKPAVSYETMHSCSEDLITDSDGQTIMGMQDITQIHHDIYVRSGNLTGGYQLEKADWMNMHQMYRLRQTNGEEICFETCYYYLEGKLYKEYIENYDYKLQFLDSYQYLTKNGGMIANDGSKMVLVSLTGQCFLVDLAQQDENGNPLILTEMDYMEMSDNEKWLVNIEEQWGYADHTGQVLALFEDAGAFAGGYAGVIIDGQGYIIDEELKKVASIGPAQRTWTEGELIGFQTASYGNLYYKYEK